MSTGLSATACQSFRDVADAIWDNDKWRRRSLLTQADLIRTIAAERKHLFTWHCREDLRLFGVAIAYLTQDDPREVHLHTILSADRSVTKVIHSDLSAVFATAATVSFQTRGLKYKQARGKFQRILNTTHNV